MSRQRPSEAEERRLVLAFDRLQDPRDLAEVIHLAAAASAEVHLIRGSLRPDHWKVLRKLKSWRPPCAEKPEDIAVRRYESIDEWLDEARASGFFIAGTAIRGGLAPWSGPRPQRVAILLGEETHGLARSTLQRCDAVWTIPLGPGGLFFTVGQATALILGGWIATGAR